MHRTRYYLLFVLLVRELARSLHNGLLLTSHIQVYALLHDRLLLTSHSQVYALLHDGLLLTSHSQVYALQHDGLLLTSHSQVYALLQRSLTAHATQSIITGLKPQKNVHQFLITQLIQLVLTNIKAQYLGLLLL